ncbi:MAG: hypothetical protein K8R90_06015 [Candidatus Cloacimonetes bacterium]|nr:hypothetical protein [Candidatus Cloacimonadota bacterium]
MNRFIIVALMLTAVLNLNAQSSQVGFVRTHFATLVGEDAEYAVLENTLEWKLGYKKGNTAFSVSSALTHDGLSDELDISLRQAWFDIYFDNVDIRLGRQQIIWGKADGAFITDVISPRDLSEFILPDFEEIRIAVTAAKLNWYLGNSTLEAVWIPAFQATILPDSSSIWAPSLPDFPMPATFDYSKATVNDKPANSEAALKFSYMGSSMDFEIMAAYLWDDNPTMHLYPQADNTLKAVPQHHRLPLAGTSLGKPVGGAVVRSESAYYFGKKFASEDLAANGICERDFVHYLVGYDHNWFEINVSFQFIQEYILDYDESIRNDEFTSTATFLASKTFLRETLELSLFSYYGVNEQDALLRPKFSYDIADGFNFLLGANIFIGDEGRFGQYNANDMVYLKIRYDFRVSN